MPSGMIGMPKPCSARPTTIGSSDVVIAAISEPPISISAQVISIGLAPYMSPSLPNTGVATAAVSSVAVTAHDASDGLASSSFGSSGISGMMSVCIRETLIPATERTAIRIAGCRAVSAGRVDDPALLEPRRPTSRTLHVSYAIENLLLRRQTSARSAGTSWASALPRCDAASFSSGVSSAADRDDPSGTNTGS